MAIEKSYIDMLKERDAKIEALKELLNLAHESLDSKDERIAELEKRNSEILNRVAEAETRMLAAVLGSTGAIEDCKKSMEAHNLEQRANGCFEAILNINAYSKNGSAFILVRDVNNFGVKKQLQAKALKEQPKNKL
jgi:hypothetical protein